jgi:hypothetical protein
MVATIDERLCNNCFLNFSVGRPRLVCGAKWGH